MFERYLYFLLFLTASWDIFGKIVIAGYSFRGFYFIEIFLFILLLYKNSAQRIKIVRFPGFIFFIIWMFFIILWMPNTTVFFRSLGYCLWLSFSFLLLILLCSNFNTLKKYIVFLKLWITSYIFMAFFGIIQFIAGCAGISLKTTQWWIPGILPRVNGICYEPSYFGTYLAGGAVFLFWLTFVEKIKIISKQMVYTLILFIAVFLTTSRIGIITILFAILLQIFFKLCFPIVLNFKLKKKYIKQVIVYFIIVSFLVLTLIKHFNQYKFLLSGTGIGGTASHSVSTRTQQMIDTFKVFLTSPIIGVSLGGIPSHIAQLHGKTIHTQFEAKNYEGMNVLVEVLAASGVIGYLFFILFWIKVAKVHFRCRRYLTWKYNKDFLALLDSLAVMLLSEFFALLMNQNILRPYLWLTIGFYLAFLNLLNNQLKRGNYDR